MSKKIEADSKIQYSIRMLNWHTKLARKNYEIVKKWLDTNDLNYDNDLLEYIKKKSKSKKYKELTIFDFIK